MWKFRSSAMSSNRQRPGVLLSSNFNTVTKKFVGILVVGFLVTALIMKNVINKTQASSVHFKRHVEPIGKPIKTEQHFIQNVEPIESPDKTEQHFIGNDEHTDKLNKTDQPLILKKLDFECTDAEPPRVRKIIEPYRAFVVETCGNIVERIRQFNVLLDSLRTKKLAKHNKTLDWSISSPRNMTLLGEWNEDYFESLSNFSQVSLVVLPWLRKNGESSSDWSSLRDTSNLPVHEYYESSGSDTLCKWIETPKVVGFSFDVINNWTCNRNSTRGALPQSISLMALNAKAPYERYYYPPKYPEHFFTELPSILYSLSIVESGVIDFDGDVYIKDAKIVPYGCFPTLKIDPPKNIEALPIYDEVLVITQRFGVNNYHRLGETFPRIALLVDFVKHNPNIKIHVPTENRRLKEYLTILGIDANRIIYDWCRAEIIYLPRANPCCFPNFLESQFLSRLFRQYIRKNSMPILRNKVVIIRRSNFRFFHDQQKIEEVVQKAAVDYNLTFEVFRDNPLPSIPDMMRSFNSAVMVVASHGAGLGNLVFSEPGTFVIEGVCNPPVAHLFFQRSALIFGHRYHGLASTAGCFLQQYDSVRGEVTVAPSVVNETVRTYLDFIVSRKFANEFSSELPL